MNIFFTSECPIECAKALDDKRVVKMCLETAQMLATAINERGGSATYKSTHKNHPSAVWVRESRENYHWTVNHFKALCIEYTNRYGKTHKCLTYLTEFLNGARLMPTGKLTKFANCAANADKGISYKHLEDVTLAYRLYLNDRWDSDVRKPTWYGVNKAA